jgi:hypothetical protein
MTNRHECSPRRKDEKIRRDVGAVCCVGCFGFQGQLAYSQAKGASDTVQVHVVITNEAVQDGSDAPVLTPETVKVTQDKTPLRVRQVLPAKGENAALLLFILIDATRDTSVGNNLNDIKDC